MSSKEAARADQHNRTGKTTPTVRKLFQRSAFLFRSSTANSTNRSRERALVKIIGE
jgi:hypothetical protein